MTEIGHNRGPRLTAGTGWQKHCWSKARADLLPKLPIEVIRTRLNRAKELGLDYKAYASVRAKTGHDIVALLFSSNALRILRADQDLSAEKVQKLGALVRCDRLLAVSQPMEPDALKARFAEQGIEFAAAIAAPTLSHSLRQTRKVLETAFIPHKLPRDKVLLVGDTMLEADWVNTASLGAFLPSDIYFSGASV